METLLFGLVLIFLLVSFVLEKLPVDVTAFIGLGLLLLFRLVTPQQATAGFGNPAVVTVMMMFILSEGLAQSGAVRRVGFLLLRAAGRKSRLAASALQLRAGGVSAFVSNTATVAIFLPLGLDLAKRYRISPSKLLLPLSYAAIFGGTCTLIGTSTNLLVSALMAEAGLRPLGMFELLRAGSLFFAVGMAFNLWLAPRLLPDRVSQNNLTGKYRMSDYLTELTVPAASDLVGRTVLEEELAEHFRIHLLGILRNRRRIATDLRNT
ncbi:MAG: SLC13 family permease, partial [Acidobacteria bacterium]|nr:SLC13 family permease [Acidobacteriota bacterium]